MNEPTLHEALRAAGYRAERVYTPQGEFRGMRILKGDKQVHRTPTASAQYGWALVNGLVSPDAPMH